MADKNSIFRMTGSSKHSDGERQIDDFYATDPRTVELFLEKLKEDNVSISRDLWESACGDGAISDVLKQHGYNVFSTDIRNRNNYADKIYDFLFELDEMPWHGDIFTNPPFKHAEEFVSLGMRRIPIGNKIILLLRLQFLEGVARRKLFDQYPPKFVYVHSKRQKTYKNNDPKYRKEKSGSAVCFAWFIWERGFCGFPQIRWI